MDTLGESLSLLHLTSLLHWRTELFAPWGLRMQATDDMVFHVVERGICWLQVAGLAAPLLLGAGDFVILPHGPQHALVDDLATAPRFIQQVRFSTERGCQVVANTGTGSATTILCGIFRYAHGDGPPLRSLLPPVIHCPRRDNDDISTCLGLLGDATRDTEPGATLIQSRLADVLFVHAMRRWLMQSEGMPSWLHALRDPQVGTALGLMQGQPEHHWTVAELATTVGLSVSAFSARFTALVGQAPMRYLTAWRIAQAARALRRTDAPIADISVGAGYATPAAFSKAFKQVLGVGPRSYRLTHQQQHD